MDPWDAFGLNSSHMIALVGAGGKTSLMFALAALARHRGAPVITTTSTRIYPPTPQQSPALVLTEEEPRFLNLVRESLAAHGHVTLARTRVEPGKLAGPSVETLDQLPAAFPTGLILVEADGAQGLPLKAPADHEPVIPSASDSVIAVMGLSALDQPLDGGRVFRPELFADHARISPGEPITPEALARALFHPQGPLRAVPLRALIIPFLNQADTVLPERARETAEELIRAGAGRVARVVWGSVLKEEFYMATMEALPWRDVVGISDQNLPGACLAGARYREGLTQRELAQKTGIPQRHISEMENGKRPIGKDRAKVLAEALNEDYRIFL